VSNRKGSLLPLLPSAGSCSSSCSSSCPLPLLVELLLLLLLLPLLSCCGAGLPFSRRVLASNSSLASASVYCSSSMLATLSTTLRRGGCVPAVRRRALLPGDALCPRLLLPPEGCRLSAWQYALHRTPVLLIAAYRGRAGLL